MTPKKTQSHRPESKFDKCQCQCQCVQVVKYDIIFLRNNIINIASVYTGVY